MAASQAGQAWRDIDLARVKLADGGDGFKRSWIMVMPQGVYDHPQYGKLDFSRTKLEEFKANFDKGVRHIDIALDQDHDGGKATGWIEEFALRDGGLWAKIRWTPLGEQLLKDQIYRYFSPEFGKSTDENGKATPNVIIGGALTNRPFLKSMPAVKLKDKQMGQRFQRPGRYTKADRAKIAPEDFAGPNRTFPIVTQQDVHDAARLIGHAANPAAVKARVIAIAKRKGFALPDAWTSGAAQKAGEAAVGTQGRRKKLAEEDEQPVADEVADEQELDQADEAEGEEEDIDEGDELDDAEDEEELEDDAQLAEKSSASGKGKPFPGASKPFGKGGKRGQPAADDAEDEADAGDDEDTEEMDDGTVDDEEYDDGEEDEEEQPQTARKRGERGKAMKAGTSRKMTEPQLLAENTRLREEVKQLREEQFKLNVNRKLSEITRNIRRDGDDEEFALPRSIKLAYQEFMFEYGVRLSEAALTKLDDLVEKSLRLGTVPLTSFANQVERRKLRDMDDQRPRVAANDPDMTDDAEKIALSEYKMPLDQLAEKNPDALATIYFGLEARRKGKRNSVA